ncbi:thioredoxin fold domain-containing protein [Kosmotoga sp. DU53]|uniref:thioredoxin family protein n=1 Tax=Kosmotoga sp. DU53 TaxID=1310160 RepID=UPI0007C599AA|nr:thioredoxin fold domain-containing protein [Kosmotoga sp. DU53]MDK2954429.1 hypothetical protein [Kosmotoga sp.]OAA24449.1 hypothetical protein DU53_00890 [Kosmotoga sp. DU53]
MKRIMVLFSVLVIATLSLAYIGKLDDFNVGMKLAKLEKKQLIVMFSDPSCFYCTKFQKETLVNDKVQELLKAGYIFVEIYPGEEEATIEVNGKTYNFSYSELYAAFEVRGTPTFWFFDENGTPITNLPGYAPADIFVKVLQYMGEKAYKKGITFDAYTKQNSDYIGESKLIKLTKKEADFVLENDPLARTHTGEFDRYTIWVTENEALASELISKGAFRVILVIE